MTFRVARRHALLPVGLISLTLFPGSALSQFDPPRIAQVLHKKGCREPQSEYFEDKLLHQPRGRRPAYSLATSSTSTASVLSFPASVSPCAFFIGTLKIELAQQGSAVGSFAPNRKALEGALIKYKSPMKGDVVVPRLILDSGVLFDAGDVTLKAGAAQEFQKIANFVRMFTPSKLVIEGHTDSDGTTAANQKLSETRSGSVRDYMILEYDFITEQMIDAVGYGEDRPIVGKRHA